MRIVVTGGLGFIGSHLIRWILRHQPSVEIINVDALTYAANPANLQDIAGDARYSWVRASVSDEPAMRELFSRYAVDAVIHLAAESHVDRSIERGLPFVETNVVGTQVLVEVARRHGVGRFVQVSTDEVYGSLGPEGLSDESAPLKPRSPYAASKAAADLLVLAAHHTHGQHVVVTRCSNNFGPYQYPEKLIPLWITNGLEGKPWPLYGDGKNVRDWIYVEDHVEGIWRALIKGRPGEVYNLGARNEQTNWEVAEALWTLMGLSREVVVLVPDRPGHDRRYALNPAKAMRELGWQPRHHWHQALQATVAWYHHHRSWWEPLKSGAFLDDYRRRYPTLANPGEQP
jgi:dTDP-glucose 4,6-dehydratase